VEERPCPANLAARFVLPRTATGTEAWFQGALNCLPLKRPSDLWTVAPYGAQDPKAERQPEEMSESKHLSEATPGDGPARFTSDLEAAEAAFRKMANTAECADDVWGAVRQSLQPQNEPAKGARKLIVYSQLETGVPQDLPELTSAARNSNTSVQAISLAPNSGLEDLCRRTQGNYQVATSESEVAGLIEEAYGNLLACYLITYQPAATKALSLTVRIFDPTGWGELKLEVPHS
jgi:hypothetical protein